MALCCLPVNQARGPFTVVRALATFTTAGDSPGEETGPRRWLLFAPADVSKTINVPKVNVTNSLGPRLPSRQIEFVPKVVINIEAEIDDVSLMN